MERSHTRTLAIIQARMGSTRLPGKVLKLLAGKPVLSHVVNRLTCCRRLDGLVVATTTEPEDDVIEQWGHGHHISVFRGSACDVLDRYYQAAKTYEARAIVRITADCPLIDPWIVDEVIEGFYAGHYHVYGLSGEFPDGLDCEVMTFPALAAAWRLARRASDREHVTPFLHNHPGQFRAGQLEKFHGLAHHRWTLDEEADYRLLQEIFNRLFAETTLITTQDVLALLDREPHLLKLNAGITRNEGYLASLAHDYNVSARSLDDQACTITHR